MATHKPHHPEMAAGEKKSPPVHPGAVIKAALDSLDPPVAVNAAAQAIGWSRSGLGLVCNEKRPVSAECALRIAAFLGNGPKGAELFMALQVEFDLYHERRRLKSQLARIKPARPT